MKKYTKFETLLLGSYNTRNLNFQTILTLTP